MVASYPPLVWPGFSAPFVTCNSLQLDEHLPAEAAGLMTPGWHLKLSAQAITNFLARLQARVQLQVKVAEAMIALDKRLQANSKRFKPASLAPPVHPGQDDSQLRDPFLQYGSSAGAIIVKESQHWFDDTLTGLFELTLESRNLQVNGMAEEHVVILGYHVCKERQPPLTKRQVFDGLMVRMTMGSPPPKPQLDRPRHPLGTAPPTGTILRALASQGLSKEPPVSAPDSLAQGKEQLPTVTPVTMVSQENQAPTFAAAAPASPPYKAKPTVPSPAPGQAAPGEAPRGRAASQRPGGSYAASHTQGEGVTEMTPRCVCNWDKA